MNVLVVAAHPDDEIIGCGGTIAKHIADGDEVNILILGEGVTSRSETRTMGHKESELSALNRAALVAAETLGANNVTFENLPDNRFDSVNLLDVVKKIETVKSKVRPDIVYTHHFGDLNIDHRITHQAVLTAFRPSPGELCKAIYAFEVASSTEWQTPSLTEAFIPNYYVDISLFLSKKLQALVSYGDEIRGFPHPRSIEGVEMLAKLSGSHVGVAAAERFAVVRSIWR